MSFVLIWIILLLPSDSAPGKNQRVLTSGSAEFQTLAACVDAAEDLRSIEQTWREDRPVVITNCMPSRTDSDK